MTEYSKKDIRKLVLEKREAVEFEIRRQYDKDIFTRLVNSDFYKNAKIIFAFVSFRSEVDTHQIISHAIADNKTICVPRIESREKGMEVFKIDGLSQLKTGYFGILEPLKECPSVNSDDIDLILMPGVAFDRQGGRVGYGAGYYDRFLRKMNKRVDKIALAYDFQIFGEVPMDESDVRIDGIITNEEFIIVNR